MPHPVITEAMMRETIALMNEHGGNQTKAAAAANVPRGTFQNRLREAERRLPQIQAERLQVASAPPAPPPPSRDVELESLRRQLRDAQSGQSMQDWAKGVIMSADEKARDRAPAQWIGEHHRSPSSAGIPSLLLSDLHHGEVVRSEEVGGCNEFNMEISRQRIQRVIDKTCVLLRDHVVGDYPGIVVAFGGDMVSGAIHDELEQTNDGTVMEQMLDLFEQLQAAIKHLADEFGKVHLPCVTGNHGRSNKKWAAKRRAVLSYEWLMYQFLQRAFSSDDRITWQIADGPDTDYSLLGTRYRLTHGDSFKGGDGMIGALGPVTRGTIKRGIMAQAMNAPFDVLLMGHWHMLTCGSKYVVNGSTKGFDEYAMSLSITPEPPSQALWLTNETHGRTIWMPVYPG